MLPERDEWIWILEEAGQLGWFVEAVARRERVHHQHIENSDGAERAGDGERNAAPRVACFFAEGCRGVKADERQQAEHHPETDSGKAGGRRRHQEYRGGVARSGRCDRGDAEDEEYDDLNDEQGQVEVDRRFDAAKRQPQHDRHCRQAEQPPLDVCPEGGENVVVHERTERGEEAGGQNGIPDPEQPTREKSCRRPKPLGVERIERPGRGELARELHNRVSHESCRDECDEE